MVNVQPGERSHRAGITLIHVLLIISGSSRLNLGGGGVEGKVFFKKEKEVRLFHDNLLCIF